MILIICSSFLYASEFPTSEKKNISNNMEHAVRAFVNCSLFSVSVPFMMYDKAVSQCNHFICQRQTNTHQFKSHSQLEMVSNLNNNIRFHRKYNHQLKKKIQSATTEKNAIKLKLIEIKNTLYTDLKAAVRFTRILHLLSRNPHVKCLFYDNKSHFGLYFSLCDWFSRSTFFSALVCILLTYQRMLVVHATYNIVSLRVSSQWLSW